MRPHIFANLDFIFLFYGAAFFFFGAACLILAVKEKEGFASWLSLALFGFLHGVSVWLEMISVSLALPRFLGPGRGVLMFASFVFLLDFFRREISGRILKKAGSGPFKIAAVMLFFYAVSSLAGVRIFVDNAGFPVQLLRGFLAWGAALILLCAATSSVLLEKRKRLRDGVWSTRIILGAFLACSAISIFLGFILVRAVDDHERMYLERMIRSDARVLRLAVGPVDFEAFEGARDGSLYPRYRAMHEKMAELSDMATFIKSLCLVAVKDGHPIFLVGSQTQIFPLDLPSSFGETPEKILLDALHSKNPTFWRREDRGLSAKSRFCVFIPLLNSSGEARLILGMDLDVAKIQHQIAKARLLPLFVVGAFLILLVGGYASLTIFALKNAELDCQRTELKKALADLKETEAELSKSEETFRGILNNSPNAIFGFDRDLRLIFWNTGAEKLYGWRRAELIDDKNPLLSKKVTDILGFEAAVRLEEVFAGITRQEEGAQSTKSGMMDAAMTLFPVRDKHGHILFGMGLVQNVCGFGRETIA